MAGVSRVVVVTGGAGFIGSTLVDALLARGDRVVVIDDLSHGRLENLEGALATGATLRELDVRDGAGVRELVGNVRPQVVFHLAAQVDVRASVADPGHDLAVNTGGTLNVLEAARATGARVVLASTGGALYGEVRDAPVTEAAPLRPLSPYGQSKRAAEAYCELYGHLHGLDASVLRFANVYGPRQDPTGGAGVVAVFCAALRDGQRPTVFGDGRQTRDYLYVDDVVEAFLAAAEQSPRRPLNIGSGVRTSVLELVELLAGIGTREDFQPRFEPPRPGEIHDSCLDPSLARETMGWTAGTPIARGLELTYRAVAESPS